MVKAQAASLLFQVQKIHGIAHRNEEIQPGRAILIENEQVGESYHRSVFIKKRAATGSRRYAHIALDEAQAANGTVCRDHAAADRALKILALRRADGIDALT